MRLLFFLYLLLPSLVYAQSVRRVDVECRALFPFDPISGRYVAGSMSQVAAYTEQWRLYDSLSLRVSKRLMGGYQIYEQLVDSTLSDRVLEYFSPYTAVSKVDSTLIDFSQMPHSKRFNEQFNSDIQRVKRFFATPLCKIVDTLRARESFYGASAYGSLFHRFQLEVSGADVSLFAPPHADGVLHGEMFVADLLRIFRYDNSLVVVRMSGKELREYLERIYHMRYHKVRERGSDIVKWNLPAYLHISVAGVSFRYNLTKGRIEDLSAEDDRLYSVVLNSFHASKIDASSAVIGDYRILLAKWLMGLGDVRPSIIEQWRLHPESWVELKNND